MTSLPGPPRRRHGAELEAALLSAAWDEVVEVGYARLTMGSVAVRAHTSEPVLYRRWPNKAELVMAAIVHERGAHPIATPDTGALRSDLIAELRATAEALSEFYVIAVATAFSGLARDTGLTPMQVRDRLMDARSRRRERAVYRRARDRGELDPERIPRTVLELPFELVRADLLMTMRPPSSARITSIVDDAFLPLVHHHQRDRR